MAEFTAIQRKMVERLSQQGYLVMNTRRKYKPGQKIRDLNPLAEFAEQPWYVIAEATRQEAEQQLLEIWGPSQRPWRFPYFYRVGTD